MSGKEFKGKNVKQVSIDGVDESLISNFRRFLHEWVFLQMKSVREEGLSIPQLFTLRYLYYNKDKNLSSIACFMGVSKPAVTGLINTLEKEGFVKREHNLVDRRKIEIVLTRKSLALFGKFESRSIFVIDEFLQSIPKDSLAQLNKTMVLLTEKLNQAIAPGEAKR